MPRSVDTDVYVLPSGIALPNLISIQQVNGDIGGAAVGPGTARPFSLFIPAIPIPNAFCLGIVYCRFFAPAAAWSQCEAWGSLWQDDLFPVMQGPAAVDWIHSGGPADLYLHAAWWFPIPDPAHHFYRLYLTTNTSVTTPIYAVGCSAAIYSGPQLDPNSVFQ